jgi:hypothetical protein
MYLVHFLLHVHTCIYPKLKCSIIKLDIHIVNLAKETSRSIALKTREGTLTAAKRGAQTHPASVQQYQLADS